MMFVFLSKFLPLLIYPAGLMAVLLIASLVLRKKRRWQTTLTLIALAVLWLAGSRWVAQPLARSLEWQYLPPASLTADQVVVVLGGSTEPADYPRTQVEVNSAGDRVLAAVVLYRTGTAKHILLSGGSIDWLQERGTTPADEMKNMMQALGVPQNVLWIQPQSQNTYEDALYSCEMLKDNGVQRAVLVTSAMHMPRSVALFAKQGCDVIPYPVDYTITEAGWHALWHPDWQTVVINLLPSSSSLALTTNVMKEYIGYLVYLLQGWI